MKSKWIQVKIGELVDYIQPTEYIVQNTHYSDNYKVPVLTPGKSFIKGYTNDNTGIFNLLPVIIFDDFTTASQYVNFPFKVKSSAMKILKPSCKLINLRYVFYGMQIIKLRVDTHKRYWIADYSKQKIPLAPLNEQNRIVSRIDELFSELENNEKNLLLAQKQLGIYKQSLLKFAFEGRLTEQWRKENKPESVEKLLERIKRDKIARYEEEMKVWKIAVNKWEEEGKKGKKPMKPVSPVQDIPLEQFETNAFPEIPVEWKWIRNSDLLYYVTSGSRDWKKYYSKQGAYFIRTQDIKTNILELDQAAFVDLPDKVEGKRSLVEKGDLLMTITGANVGKVAYIDKNIPEAYVSQSVALMKFVDVGITPYLHLYFQSNVFGGKMIGNLVYGLGRPVLSLENMKEVPVAICSIEEQEVIVSKVTAILMATDHLEEIIRQSINQLDVLRQSILKKAFEGRLVKQDPTDEPASELLKRIQAEKKKYLEDQKTQKKTKSKKEKVMKEALSIEEVLRATNKPMLAKEVWLQSKHSHNIEEFYAELRKIQDNIKEVKKGTESLLSLIK